MKLKELRKEKGLTQKEIATLIQVAPTTYLGYEKETSEPNIDTLIKLAKFYNISVDNLLGIEETSQEITNEETSQLITIIKKLNTLNTIKAISYCSGLLANQN